MGFPSNMILATSVFILVAFQISPLNKYNDEVAFDFADEHICYRNSMLHILDPSLPLASGEH